MSKMYVILKRSYEYNDEGYDSSDGGNIHLAFHSYEEANKELNRLLKMSLTDPNYSYLYDKWDSPFDTCYEVDVVLNKYGLESDDSWDEMMEKFGSMSDEDLNTLIGRIYEPMFFIEEAEVK